MTAEEDTRGELEWNFIILYFFLNILIIAVLNFCLIISSESDDCIDLFFLTFGISYKMLWEAELVLGARD